ncbi:MAG: leucyl aminopeptidase family protein [Alphaproteobacteria bacterium]|nr:leucyl aminopeptidase family protein [Alphaproteobacteria bacterium]
MPASRSPFPIIPAEDPAAVAARPIYLARRDPALDGVPEDLRSLAELNEFKGDIGAVLAGPAGVLVGNGDGSDPFALAAAPERLSSGAFRLAVDPETDDECLSRLLAWTLGGYQFERYRQGGQRAARLVAPARADLDRVRRLADAVWLARDLVNTPAGDLLPDGLEAVAREIALEAGAKIETTTGAALLERNFPLIHAVGRASVVEPRLIDIRWGDPAAPKVTIVGKGVCFDSGGLNLKGAGGMAIMKKDMGGAANALALGRLIMDAGLPIRLRILIPAVENAVSGAAFRPGDILTSRKGLTVEIGNTDAEGRLVLADAMALGGEERPALMITLATLTGAARVALGPELPPFYCDDDNFVADVLSSAQRVADPVWRMPLWAGYEQMLSTPIADLNNAPGGPFAGSILAALFLKRFASEASVWSHFDIYAWRAKAAPGRPVGGEAQAIRALFDSLERRFG